VKSFELHVGPEQPKELSAYVCGYKYDFCRSYALFKKNLQNSSVLSFIREIITMTFCPIVAILVT